MNWVRAIVSVFVLWSSAAGGATLTWNANGEPDLAGYRIYYCSLLPCTKSSGNLLVTLGKVTSFNIGTPTVTQYYFITAYDFANNESGSSNIATFNPAGSPPPPPPTGTVSLMIAGNPATGAWGVLGSTTDPRDVMAKVYLDQSLHHIEHDAPYGFPNDNGVTATTGLFGSGSHTVQFVFFLEGTTTEIGRASVTVQEGSPSPPPPPPMGAVSLMIVGNPATGAWGVLGTVADFRDVMADIFLDGVFHHTEHTAPYGFPNDNGLTATTAKFGNGSHTVQFIFKLEGTTTEIGRASVTVQEGSPSPPPMGTVTLTVVGNPATGAWGVLGSTTDPRDVMAKVYLDQSLHHIEHDAPYGFPNDNGLTATTAKFGSGYHTVEFVFFLEGTTTEIGRASVTVQEG